MESMRPHVNLRCVLLIPLNRVRVMLSFARCSHGIDNPIMHVDFMMEVDYTPWYQPMYFIQGITPEDLPADDRFYLDLGVAAFVDIS